MGARPLFVAPIPTQVCGMGALVLTRPIKAYHTVKQILISSRFQELARFPNLHYVTLAQVIFLILDYLTFSRS